MPSSKRIRVWLSVGAVAAIGTVLATQASAAPVETGSAVGTVVDTASGTSGGGLCHQDGVEDNGSFVIALAGEATSVGAVASTSIECRVYQGTTLVIDSKTSLPLNQVATATEKAVPIRSMITCGYGHYVTVLGSKTVALSFNNPAGCPAS